MNTSTAKERKRVILHITPHLGGGVGRVILNYLAKVIKHPDFSHKVLSLEYANENALLASRTTGFILKDKMSANHDGIISEIEQADIVLIHWWNHPLLYAFLVRETLPPCRMIFWSHIAGFHAPYVFNKPALHYPDLFVFTSPISLEVTEVKDLKDDRKKALRVIWSTGGIEHVASVQPKFHAGFKIGYIGTVDYSKMHPGFLKMSEMVQVPDAKFIVCGGPGEKEIREEAVRSGMGERITFAGQVNNIAEYLAEFDVLGYPLAPYHWGTCEQSLCESMAAGVPPVVLANRAESYIVEDGVTGIVAKNEGEYARAIEELYRDKELRRRLSCNAREAARRRFSIEEMIDKWDKVFDEVFGFPKVSRRWTGKYQGENILPYQLFLEALGGRGEEFLLSSRARTEEEKQTAEEAIINLGLSSYLWRAKSRGTPQHYHFFFPEDDFLKNWSGLISSLT